MYTICRILNHTLISNINVHSNAPLINIHNKGWLLTLFLMQIIFSLNAQISGKVFVDLNQNGRFDQNEIVVQKAQINVYQFDPNTTKHPLLMTLQSDPFGNFNFFPSNYPIKMELILRPQQFPLLPGKGYINLPDRELYPFPGLVINQPGIHNLPLPVNISY